MPNIKYSDLVLISLMAGSYIIYLFIIYLALLSGLV